MEAAYVADGQTLERFPMVVAALILLRREVLGFRV